MLATYLACAGAAQAADADRVAVVDVVTSYVNVRAEPAADARVIGQLQRGQSVLLIGASNGWLEVSLGDDNTGYVSRDWTKILQADDEAGASMPRVTTTDAVTTYVNVRAEPDAASAVTGSLGAGMMLPLIKQRDGWFEVALSDGQTGFVSRSYTRAVHLDSAVRADVSSEELPQPGIELPTVPDAGQHDRSVLVEPTRLLEQGNPMQAYELLARLEAAWGGDAGFDYLYGIAALESGRPGEAIFSLERVLRSLPDFVGARLDLARALYELGDREQAEREFKALLEADPPEQVREIIDTYIAALTPPEPERERASRVLYAAATGGYDTNANGAADLDDFLGFTLNPRSTEQGTPFVEARFGGIGRHPLPAPVELLWRADAKHRHNPNANFIDHTFFNATAALGFSRGKNDIITGISTYWSALDASFNERSAALDLAWLRPLGDYAVRGTFRGGPVRFSGNQNARDVDRYLYTLTLRQPIRQGSGTLAWSLVAGRDNATVNDSPYSNDRFGGRVGARWTAATHNLAFDIGQLNISYRGRGFFGIDRDDNQFTATLALEIPDWPMPGWSFVPSVRYANNDSNVPIFDYDRIEIGASFRVAR